MTLSKTLRILVCSTLFSLCISAVSAQPTNAQPTLDSLYALMSRMRNNEQDFSAYEKSYLYDSHEFEIAMNFSTISNRVYEYLNSASALLLIYSRLSSDSDRQTAAPIIRMQLTYYIGQIPFDITDANTALSNTNSQAIAVSGSQLREDLRNSITLLESIVSQL